MTTYRGYCSSMAKVSRVKHALLSIFKHLLALVSVDGTSMPGYEISTNKEMCLDNVSSKNANIGLRRSQPNKNLKYQHTYAVSGMLATLHSPYFPTNVA